MGFGITRKLVSKLYRLIDTVNNIKAYKLYT